MVKNITKAGIRAEIDDNDSPLIIYIARDHNYSNKDFINIKENDKIVVKVIGIKYELNDNHVYAICTLEGKEEEKKQKIILKES